MTDRIAVLAPGGIGGPIGALLTLAGHDVTLIDQWPEHVNAMRHGSLRLTIGPLDEPEAEYSVDVRTFHVHEVCTLEESFDIVFVTSKSYDTRWLAQLIEPKLASGGVVVSIQNSLNYEWILPIVGEGRVIGCLLTGGGELVEPGHVWRNRRLDHHYFTIGELDGRASRRVERITAILGKAGKTTIAADIKSSLWTKLIHNSVSAALSGLVAGKQRSWELISNPDYRRVSADLFREGVDVASAYGQKLEPLYDVPTSELRNASDDAIVELFSATGGGASKGATSMVQQDLARGRPTEVRRFFNGLLAEKARKVGVKTPMNETMVGLYERLERGELRQGIENLTFFSKAPASPAGRKHNVG